MASVKRRQEYKAATAIITIAVALSACGETATLPVSAGIGPRPTLPPPALTLIPTVNIAPAIGWPVGTTPTAAEGMKVSAFASGFDHPRWLYVLPNGDVLVAESNAPNRPLRDDLLGLKGIVMGFVMGLESYHGKTMTQIAQEEGLDQAPGALAPAPPP